MEMNNLEKHVAEHGKVPDILSIHPLPWKVDYDKYMPAIVDANDAAVFWPKSEALTDVDYIKQFPWKEGVESDGAHVIVWTMNAYWLGQIGPVA